MPLMLERLASPLGEIQIVSDGRAVRAVDFSDHAHRLHRLLARHEPSYVLARAAGPSPFAAALDRYFDGDLAAIDDLPISTAGTAFQEAVWARLRAIPASETISYARIAASLGRPAATRAVGLANAANPVAIEVPCHRVIGADHSLTGYGGGLPRKAWLLAHERRNPIRL